MCKELAEMTLEELWQLFPIKLVPSSDNWNRQYCRIEKGLKDALSNFNGAVISHIGSTAIPGIYAKNIVDVLVEILQGDDIEAAAEAIEGCGFLRMSKSERRISLNKGYTKCGFEDEVYHVHLRFSGDNDELYFRDYLIENPDAAKEYEKLKLSLQEKYRYNRDAYTEAKSNFINKYTDIAKTIYKDRY